MHTGQSHICCVSYASKHLGLRRQVRQSLTITLDMLSAEQREYLLLAQESANHLLHIINDILDFSKIEAGKLSLESIAFNLHQTLRDCVQELQIRADEKKLAILYTHDPNTPERILGDPTRLRQVLINLIGNAIKFTDAGRVTVQLDTTPSPDGQHLTIAVSVIDTGIGIAEQDLVRIFHNFETLDASYARMREGTGLGLGIAKLSAEAMGGQITVQSVLGQGSTFTFTVTLPVAKTASTCACCRTASANKNLASW